MTQEIVPSEIAAPKDKLKAIIFSLLILLSGIIIGSGLTLMLQGENKVPTPPALPEEMSRRMMAHLIHELNLTEQQQSQIQPIIRSHMNVLDKYREEARPKIRTELDTMNEEILAILDPQQKQIWKDKIERMKQRFQETKQRRGDGPPWRKDGDRRGDRDRENWRRRRDGDPNAPQMPPPKPRAEQFDPESGPTGQPPRPEPENPEQPQ